MQQQFIELNKLKNNTGQIDGLPKNPRLLKDDKYKKLFKSIKEDPEMLELRELIVYPLKDEFIVIAGNMRLKVLQELKYEKAPCKVLSSDVSVEKLKAYTIKDNVSFGENDWDMLLNEWDTNQLVDWGMDLHDDFTEEEVVEDDFDTTPSVEPKTKMGELWMLGGEVECPKCHKHLQ